MSLTLAVDQCEVKPVRFISSHTPHLIMCLLDIVMEQFGLKILTVEKCVFKQYKCVNDCIKSLY